MFEIEQRDEIAILKMKHGKVNAMDIEFCQALSQQFQELAAGSARAVVLTSAIRVFSAGVDLRRMLSEETGYVNQFVDALDESFKVLFQFPKPLVAAISGHAVAGGCVIASACDYRIIDSRAKIGIPELRVGVPFPPIALEIMRMVASRQSFQTMVNVGQTYRHESAIAVGLADSIAGPDDLLNSAIEMACQFATIPASVFQLTKQQIRMPAMRNVEQAEQEYYDQIRSLWSSEAIREMIREYVQRRL